MEKQLYDKCLRCNRPLRTSQAQERGYGNHCWKIHNLEIQKNRKSVLDYVIEKLQRQKLN